MRKGRLDKKVCIITGSTGMGAVTAKLAAEEGALIFFTGLDASTCKTLQKELGLMGFDSDFQEGDLTKPKVVSDAIAKCVRRFGRIDAVFNVAGISGRKLGDAPLHECSDQAWDRIMKVNVCSMFLMNRAVLRQMLRQKLNRSKIRGSILNMASVLAFSPQAQYFATHAYAASKAAILGMTQSMAAYYASYKIRVNAIAPALVRTPMSRRAQQNKELLRYLKRKQPLVGGLLEPEDIARAAVFLMSDEARGITGSIQTVDGGWCLSR
jgi:NAD(P)-dependent dehydrogenase (short-subunit alcohol dehydrogenase family)